MPKPRTYTPDFYLLEQKMFIDEGYFDKGDRVKMQLIKSGIRTRYSNMFLNAKNKIYKEAKQHTVHGQTSTGLK